MRDYRMFYSLWRCPRCLKAKREAFSLHAEDAKRVACPYCHSFTVDEAKSKRFAGPRVRKVAIIKVNDNERARGFRALLLGPLNEASMQGLQPIITDLLSQLEKDGIITYRLTVDPQFL